MAKAKPKERLHGRELLKLFLEKNKLLPVDAARMLKVAPSLVYYWTHGSSPRAAYRRRIERWTRGEVPSDSWADDKELAQASDFDPLPKASGSRS